MCTGDEESLLNCTRIPAGDVGVSDCTHSEDAGVRCNGKVMLLFVSPTTGMICTIIQQGMHEKGSMCINIVGNITYGIGI